MGKTIKKDTIHANGIDIGIYTTDFENEFISLTDTMEMSLQVMTKPTKWTLPSI